MARKHGLQKTGECFREHGVRFRVSLNRATRGFARRVPSDTFGSNADPVHFRFLRNKEDIRLREQVRLMKNACTLPLIVLFAATLAFGQGTLAGSAAGQPWSQKVAKSFLRSHPGSVTYDSASPNKGWNYEQGFFLLALLRLADVSGDRSYRSFVRQNVDSYVEEDGSIRTYPLQEYSLDNLAGGRVLLSLYNCTGLPKYRCAADSLRKQIAHQPRTHEGGFWHKLIYPYQMWLDGLYMAEPFYAAYARMFHEVGDFDDVVHQFEWMASHARDQRTGLFYHGWDESRKQRWADSVSGCSPQFWGRAMGWYAMALVDVLEALPSDHPGRPRLISILRDLSVSLLRYRDSGSRMWYQIVDKPGEPGNYPETSSSCMFAYAFARGARRGYLEESFLGAARETMDGVIKRAIHVGPDGTVSLTGTCRSAGLGGTLYRDGSYSYYISEPQRTNDLKGLGAFLMAMNEIEGNPGSLQKSTGKEEKTQ
jgi:unsaturated rhamnogalacturonyl hydrolase